MAAACFSKSRKIITSPETNCSLFRFLRQKALPASGFLLHSNALNVYRSRRMISNQNSKIPPDLSRFVSPRLESSKTENERLYEKDDDEDDQNLQELEFPGGRTTFTSQMNFISDSPNKRIPCYRVLDDDGYPIKGSIFHKVSEELAVKMYRKMVTLQIMDTFFYEAQRQGRISFYMSSVGEESINIASAAALTNDDIVLPQYREPGILLWRGFTIQEFANQLFGNKDDCGQGRLFTSAK